MITKGAPRRWQHQRPNSEQIVHRRTSEVPLRRSPRRHTPRLRRIQVFLSHHQPVA
jgi:hypothetical protein